MIAYFPNPYPDELLYSLCARFSDRMQFGTETGTMLALYGSRHAVAMMYGFERDDSETKARWRDLLRQYCRLDTLAMVWIWRHWSTPRV
jgi:hypothetical protein